MSATVSVGVPTGVTELLAQRESVAVGVGEGVGDVVPVIVNDSVEVTMPEPVPEGVSVDVGVPDVDKLCVVVTVPVTLAVAPDARGTGELVGDGVPDGDCVADVAEAVPDGLPVPDPELVAVPVDVAEAVEDAVLDPLGVREDVPEGELPTDKVVFAEDDFVDVAVIDAVTDAEPV